LGLGIPACSFVIERPTSKFIDLCSSLLRLIDLFADLLVLRFMIRDFTMLFYIESVFFLILLGEFDFLTGFCYEIVFCLFFGYFLRRLAREVFTPSMAF
jgi:hypothetical protein